MNEKDFLENYLWPSGNKLDRTYVHSLPEIEGLNKHGDYIVQGEYGDTFSTNIMTIYETDALRVKLVDIYKNSQNRATGVFVRLVGTMSLVKIGYPYLILDGVVSNVRLSTGERRDIKTTVAIHLPQADSKHTKKKFRDFIVELKVEGISCQIMQSDALPEFWGPTLVYQSSGVDLDAIQKLRDSAWSFYKRLLEETDEKLPFDYMPFQEHMIYNTSKREHLLFQKMGLSVPVEAQAAFFSVLVSGV